MQPNRRRNYIVILSWLIAFALPAYLVFYSITYFPLALRLSSDPVDSYGVAILLTQMTAAVLLPVCGFVTLFCTNRARPGKGLFAWRSDDPLWSIAVSLGFGLPAAGLLVLVLLELTHGLPWYEYLFLPAPLLLSMWFLLLRAAVLSKDWMDG